MRVEKGNMIISKEIMPKNWLMIFINMTKEGTTGGNKEDLNNTDSNLEQTREIKEDLYNTESNLEQMIERT